MTQSESADRIRDRLLSKETYSPEMYEQYRKEIEEMLNKESKKLQTFIRIGKWIIRPVFIYLILLGTAFMLIGGSLEDPTKKLFFAIIGSTCMIMGGVMLLNHFINEARLVLLKELKEIQLRVFELYEKIGQKQ